MESHKAYIMLPKKKKKAFLVPTINISMRIEKEVQVLFFPAQGELLHGCRFSAMEEIYAAQFNTSYGSRFYNTLEL